MVAWLECGWCYGTECSAGELLVECGKLIHWCFVCGQGKDQGADHYWRLVGGQWRVVLQNVWFCRLV